MQNYTATALLTCVALLGCGDQGRRNGSDANRGGTPQDTGLPARSGGTATAALRDAAGKDVGTLTLRDSAGRITITGRLTGLPRGEHAIHLHTVGRCDPPKFQSAGDHWNPTGRQHGTRNPEGPHLGDLPNITVGGDGSVRIEAITPGGTLRSANPLLDSDGASVVVHAKRDDYKSQPSGNSGDRIACAIVSG
jgi:Cu-Zn family superoxide dismutase